jgi:hypothetical protein
VRRFNHGEANLRSSAGRDRPESSERTRGTRLSASDYSGRVRREWMKQSRVFFTWLRLESSLMQVGLKVAAVSLITAICLRRVSGDDQGGASRFVSH